MLIRHPLVSLILISSTILVVLVYFSIFRSNYNDDDLDKSAFPDISAEPLENTFEHMTKQITATPIAKMNQIDRLRDKSNETTHSTNNHFFSFVLNYTNSYDFNPIINSDHAYITYDSDNVTINANNSTALVWSVPFRNFSVSAIKVQFKIIEYNQTEGHSGLSWQGGNGSWWYVFVRPQEIVLYNDRYGEVERRSIDNLSLRELHSLSVSLTAHNRMCILLDDQPPICVPEKRPFDVSRVGLRSYNSVAEFGPITVAAFYSLSSK